VSPTTLPSRPKPIPCKNMSHRRRDALVRYCPDCGEIVNARAMVVACNEAKHAWRLRRTRFCVDCGKQLRAGQP
jgi:hypothetical protein